MSNSSRIPGIKIIVAAAMALASGVVFAQDGGGEGGGSTNVDGSSSNGSGMFADFDISWGGFIRPELAISLGSENPNNQRGNTFNGVPTARMPGVPQPVDALGGLLPPFSIPNPLLADNVTRPVNPANNFFNLNLLRIELEGAMKFTPSLKLVARLRSIVDPGNYSSFDPVSVANAATGSIQGGDPGLYGGAPNYFQYSVEGMKRPNPLEAAGPNYLVYFPALFLDYQEGPLNVRVGNQQIAWGQAIFFRVLDVVDGIDFRRHSILDNAQEEFSDKRVPSLGVRVNYQFTDEILADAFVQKFQPTIYGNPNTQYNVIPTQFTVHDQYADYDTKLSYGIRFKGNFGQWGAQAIFVSRLNPDGVFRWTASGVNKNLPNNNALGLAVNALNNGITPNPLTGQIGTSGEILAQTPFEASPGGVYSAKEWFTYAASVRLDGVGGLNAAINEFAPSTNSLLASPVDNYTAASRELDTFFIAAGDGLRGHIAREYFREYNIGGGVSYVVEGEPGSLLDQLIINLESTYTPDRRFTNPTLSRDYIKEGNLVSALVMEKYQRFSNTIPATYMVLQYMHRTKDDLFGRSLKGYGGSVDKAATGVNGGSDYVVFAMQQPFPQAIWRIDFAGLYDVRGGLLLQPGLRWKPNGSITADIFYSYINGSITGGNPNNNALSTAAFADEITFRVGYQF
ncbi:DUF1302 family protein [Nevskia sp.]|uniref:DUF1302 family protein n=1 Tax=Nevskia sp. TaxID=1929292 RepID=UPI0025E4D95F|nr:DUF1302 family protein [Nevskia sp.]